MLGGLVGCSVEPSTETGVSLVPHCGDSDGNLTCEMLRRGKPYCDLCRPASSDQGCASDPPSVPACRVGGSNATGTFTTTGDDTTGTSDEPPTTLDTLGSESSTAAVDSSSTSSSGGPMVPCESADGTLDADCEARDQARPYCVDQNCVACEGAGGSAFCADRDSDTPACDPDSGRCSACTDVLDFVCDPLAPVCDGSGACMPCTAHEQCPGTACHLDPSDALSGQCFGVDEVIFVDNAAICPGAGTEASPNCSLEAALDSVSEGDSRVLRIAGGTDYAESGVLAVDATVALLGDGVPTISGDGGPGLEFSDGRIYVHGIRVSENLAGPGIECSGASLRIDASEIGNNRDYGLFDGGPCDVEIRATNIFGNDGGGIRMLGGTLLLDNAAVGDNGDGQRGPGLNLQFVDVEIIYATIAGNDGVGFDSLQCIEVTGSVRNSIVVGLSTGSAALDCFTLDFANDAIDTANFAGNGGVMVSTAYNPLWFNGPDDGDFRLGAPPLTPFGDVALWIEGDPRNDADGTLRPMEGELGYAGVDEPG